MKKLCSVLLASVLCLSMLSGCGGSGSDGQSSEEQSSGKVIAYVYKDSYERYLLEGYNTRINSHDAIELTIFDDVQTMSKTIATEVLSGKGPDIFLFQDYTLPNFQSYAKQGVFTDLNPLMKKAGLNADNYQKNVFDYGVIEGKRRLIPIEYKSPVVVTTQATLDQYQLEPEMSKLNYQNFFSKMQDKVGTKEEVWWINEVDNFLFSAMKSAISADGKSSKFNSEEFRTIIQEYKQFIQTQIESYVEYLNKNSHMGLSNEMIHQGKTIFNQHDTSYTLQTITDFYYGPSENKKDILRLFKLSDFGTTDEYTAQIGMCIAINEKSKNKEQAFKLVEYALADSAQCVIGATTGGTIAQNPVSLSAQKKDKEQWLKDVSKNPTLTQFVNDYYAILDSITGVDIMTYNPNYFYEVFQPYYNSYMEDKISLDEFVKQLDNKSGIFLKEVS